MTDASPLPRRKPSAFMHGWYRVIADRFAEFLTVPHGHRSRIVEETAQEMGRAPNSIWRQFGAANFMAAAGFPLESYGNQPPPLAVIEFVSRIDKLDHDLAEQLLQRTRDQDGLTVAEARDWYAHAVARGSVVPIRDIPHLTIERLVDHVVAEGEAYADIPLADMTGQGDLPSRSVPIDCLHPITVVLETASITDGAHPGRPSRRTAIFVVDGKNRAVRGQRFALDLRGEILAAFFGAERVLVVTNCTIPLIAQTFADMREDLRSSFALLEAQVSITRKPPAEWRIVHGLP